MTTAALIQARIDYGNAIAAKQLGIAYSLYRPNGSGNPLASGNLISSTFQALFTQDTTFTKLPKTKTDEYIGYFDGSQTQPGDYLTDGSRTFFVAAQQPMLPYMVILCTRVFTLIQPAANTAAGAGTYGGTTSANGTTLLTGWPGSCLTGTKGERGDVTLPDDVKNPWWLIRLPPSAPVTINTDYILTDDLNRRYSVSSAEQSPYGWKITAKQNVT